MSITQKLFVFNILINLEDDFPSPNWRSGPNFFPQFFLIYSVICLFSKIFIVVIESEKQVIGILVDSVAEVVYLKASEIAPENPRVILSRAEWNMGSARFFGQSTQQYCKDIQRAIEIGKNEKVTKAFYPRFMVKRAEQVLKQCQE